jgi:hypothetical protein
MTYEATLPCPPKMKLNPADIAMNRDNVVRLVIATLFPSLSPRATNIIATETARSRKAFVMCNPNGNSPEPEKGSDVGMLTNWLRNIPRRNSTPKRPITTIDIVTSLSLGVLPLVSTLSTEFFPRSKLLVKFCYTSLVG